MKALDRKTLPYSVEQGGEYFDWNAALDDPDCDWAAMTSLSFRWVTCACGNQCAAIPRYGVYDEKGDACGGGTGKPKDRRLTSLGARFYNAVRDEKRNKAKQILTRIEARSAELLAEMGIA